MADAKPPPRQLKAVLFDFDGTLADSYAAIAASINHVRSLHDLPPLPVGEVRRHVGRGLTYLLQHTVPNTDLAADTASYHAHHPTVMGPCTQLLPGVRETLPPLLQQGLRLAVCSNKPIRYTMSLLADLQISSFFHAVLGPEDVAHPKPAPDMLQTALQRLCVGPRQALYVGDMTVDIETARGAGVSVWVIPTGSNDKATLAAAQPDRLLERFEELLSVIAMNN